MPRAGDADLLIRLFVSFAALLGVEVVPMQPILVQTSGPIEDKFIVSAVVVKPLDEQTMQFLAFDFCAVAVDAVVGAFGVGLNNNRFGLSLFGAFRSTTNFLFSDNIVKIPLKSLLDFIVCATIFFLYFTC